LQPHGIRPEIDFGSFKESRLLRLVNDEGIEPEIFVCSMFKEAKEVRFPQELGRVPVKSPVKLKEFSLLSAPSPLRAV
jgi:hypothetical protein